VFEKVHKRTLR